MLVAEAREERNCNFCFVARLALCSVLLFSGPPPAKIHSINFVVRVVEFLTGLSVELRVLGSEVLSPFLHYLASYQLYQNFL